MGLSFLCLGKMEVIGEWGEVSTDITVMQISSVLRNAIPTIP